MERNVLLDQHIELTVSGEIRHSLRVLAIHQGPEKPGASLIGVARISGGALTAYTHYSLVTYSPAHSNPTVGEVTVLTTDRNQYTLSPSRVRFNVAMGT